MPPPSKGRLGLSFVIGQGPVTANEIVESALLAEKCGFEAAFMPELYYDRDAATVLGAIAESTSRILMGSGIINSYSRFPSLIAMTAATLDELNRGRTILGLGSGSVIGASEDGIPNEFTNQRYEFPLGHLRELVPIVRALLAGERLTFHGKFYNLEHVALSVNPPRRRIPIYFGQQGPKMMALAGEVADGVLITLCCTVPYVKDVIQRVRASENASRRRNSSVDFGARIITSLSDDEDAAIRRAKQVVGRVFINHGSRPVMELSDIHIDVVAIKKAVDSGKDEKLNELVPDEVVEISTASGNRKHVRRRIEEFREAGVTLPIVVPIGRNYPEIIRALARG